MSRLTNQLEKMFRALNADVFDGVLEMPVERFHYPTGDRKYVMMFYLNGINAIVIQWLKDGCEKSIEDVARIIHECIFGLEI